MGRGRAAWPLGRSGGEGELGVRLRAQGWLPSTCPAILHVLLITLRVEAVSFLSQCFP